MRNFAPRLPAIMLALSCACASSTFPTAKFSELPDTVAHHPSGAVIESRELGLNYALDANNPAQVSPLATLTERVRVRVTGPEGLSFARWPLGLNDHVSLVSAVGRLTHPDGGAAQAKVDGNALVFTGVQPGDLLDVSIARRDSLPETLPAMVASDRAPTQAWRLRITAADGMLVRVATGSSATANVMPPTSPGKRPVWEVQLKDLPARAPDAPMANPGQFVVAVLNGYGVPGAPVRDVASTWDAVAAWVAEQGNKTKPNDATTQSLRGGVGRAQLSRIQERLHPHPVSGLLDTVPRPYEIAAKEGATPLEAAMVAVQVSATSMEPSRLALVARAESFPVLDALPGLYAFGDVLLAVRGDGAAWGFVDPLCHRCNPGEVGFERVGGRALVAGPQHAELVKVPLSAAQVNRQRMQFDWTLQVDGTLHGTLLAELEGAAEEPVRDMMRAKELSSEARLGALRDHLWGAGPKPIGEVSMVSRPYGVRVALDSFSAASDSLLNVKPEQLAGDGFVWKLPTSGEALLPGPLDSETVCTVVLPAIKSVEMPEPLALAGPWGTYRARFEMQEHYMVYTQSLHLTARLMSDADRAELAGAVKKIAAAQTRPVVVHLED